MNDHVRFERLFADGMHELAPKRAPDRLRTKVKDETGDVRPRARWLALMKEPPMRTNSHLAVGSPTARVAAIVTATLLAAMMIVGAGIAGAQLLAADGPIIVDQSGGGATTTITEAIAMAGDGDEILVRPGTYTESFVIDNDIAVRGDGPVEDIVVMAPEGGPIAATSGETAGEPYAVLLSESAGRLSGLTFRGQPSMVIASGGSPTVTGNIMDGVGWAFDGSNLSSGGSSIVATAGTTANITGNTVLNGGPIAAFEGASPMIEGNRLQGGPHIFLRGAASDTIVRGNEILGTHSRGIAVSSPGPIIVEGNRISDYGQAGIRVGRNAGAEGYETQVRNNTIEGTGTGVAVTQGGAPTIEGNTLSGNDLGIELRGGTATVADNTFNDNMVALSLGPGSHSVDGNNIFAGTTGIMATGGEAQLTRNVVVGASGRGIAIGGTSSPMLAGNRSCGNGENLWVSEDSTPRIDESNEICEDAVAE